MDKSSGTSSGPASAGAPVATAPPSRTPGVKKVSVPSDGCPVSAVTVYNDRAEVTRAVSALLDGVGQFDLTVEGLSQLVVADSLRVTSRSASIKILEVSYRELEAPTTDSSRVQGLQERVEGLEKEIARLNRSVEIVEGGVKLVDSFASTALVRREAVPAGAAGSSALDLDFVERVLDLRVTRLEAAASSTQDLHKQLATLNKQLAAARQELRAAQGLDRRRTPEKAATISVECAEAGPVDLLLVYMVEGSASWSPSYDLRIDSKTSTLHVTYYGNIKQNSGEDWNEARLTLSTAAPSVGGVPPALPSRRFVVGYRRPVEELERMERRGSDRALSVCFDGSDHDDGGGSLPDLGSPGAGAGAGSGTPAQPKRALAAFVIEHLATIESDNKPHKVTIATLPLPATFRHYCVPRMAPMAYVLAVCTNSTRFTLLGSKEVNVFLDGAFVAKSALPNVSSGETFRSFLGVDVAVRVEYSDVGPKSSSSGVFSKSAVVAHKYSTTIKNTKPTPINLIIADVFPSSSDARIKVLPVEPSASAIEDGTAAELVVQQGAFLDLAVGEPKTGVAPAGPDARPVVFRELVARNPVTNNLVWSKRIAANTAVALPFEFRVEAPPGVQYSLE